MTLLDDYEKQYSVLIAEITSQIAKIKLLGSGEMRDMEVLTLVVWKSDPVGVEMNQLVFRISKFNFFYFKLLKNTWNDFKNVIFVKK